MTIRVTDDFYTNSMMSASCVVADLTKRHLKIFEHYMAYDRSAVAAKIVFNIW